MKEYIGKAASSSSVLNRCDVISIGPHVLDATETTQVEEKMSAAAPLMRNGYSIILDHFSDGTENFIRALRRKALAAAEGFVKPLTAREGTPGR